MDQTTMNNGSEDRNALSPARVATASGRPWVPSDTQGKSARLLRFLPDDAGFVADGSVRYTADAATQRAELERHCHEHGLAMTDLDG